jgi:large subunit ribosomal protein L5
LAKEKVAPAAEKKVKTKKKAAKAKAPVDAKKALMAEKISKKGQPAEKKSVAKKKVSSSKEKVAPKKKAAEPEITPAKEKKKVTEKKVDESKTPSSKEKPVTEKKAEPEVAETTRREWTENQMLKPRIEKVTVNTSVGQSGKPLEQAATILQQLTDQKPSRRQAKKTIREFGIRKGESVACLVTLRKEKAEEFLRKALQAVENKLSKYCFDLQGNFAFGIKEHIDIPGTKYVPQLGIHGMDISVSLGRAGYRVKRRHRVKSKIGKNHLLTTEEAVLFIKDEFDVEII